MKIRFINFDELTRYKTAEQSPGFLFWKTHLLWKRKIEAALSNHDLTHVQFVLLAGIGYLAKDGTAITQHDLAKLTFCDVTMTSQVIRTLEKKGLVTRIQKEGDTRAKYPTVTPNGLKRLQSAMKSVEDIDEKFFGILEEKIDIVKILSELLVSNS